jgi:DNA damage-binding protein 1
MTNLLSSLSLNALGTDVPMEIAAISISPIDQTQQKSQYVIVSYWDTNEVAVFAHKRGYNFLKEVIRTGSLHSLPRSLLLYNFGSSQRPRKKDTRLTSGYLPYLLLGMADGSLTSYTFDDVQKIGKEDQYSIGDKKTVSLGTTPVSLTAMEPNDSSSAARAVCACGSHASFFFYNQGRLQQAPVLVNVRLTFPFLCWAPS